ncbi:Alpha/Beta hydrolase protein [Dichotomocladium elegans]|nr:Alpha/Beta hydrolase protein [Dichotomocladium elegans]
MVMPSSLAIGLLDTLTKPTKSQKKWIKRIDNSFWKGAIIAPGIKYNSEADAIRRLRRADIVIFELHGGGFRVGNATMYMTAFQQWINIIKEKHNLNAVIMSVEYGLAPNVKYPEPVMDCVKAYKHLTVDLRVPGTKVIFSGDSAGGALCLETLMRTYAPDVLKDLDATRTNFNIDKPAGMLMVSPLVTPETSSPSWKSNAKRDLVTQQLAKIIYKEFLGYPHVDPDSLPILRLNQVHDRFDRFVPSNVLVFVGEKEVMRDDIVALVDMVEKDGCVNIRLCKENYPHCWYVIREMVKVKDKAMLSRYDEDFADFAVKAVTEATREKFRKERELLLQEHVQPAAFEKTLDLKTGIRTEPVAEGTQIPAIPI